MKRILVFSAILFTTASLIMLGVGQEAGAETSGTLITTVSISVCGNGIKEGGEQCDGGDLGGKMCTFLGFESGNLGCSASCEFSVASCTTNASSQVGLLFGKDIGGSYSLIDGETEARIELLPNFYVKDLRLQMFSYDKEAFEASKPPPQNTQFLGKVYDFVFVDSDGSSVSALSLPAQLTLTYLDEDVGNLDEGAIKPYRRGVNDDAWSLIGGSVVDTINNRVVFSTSEFSSFTLITHPVQVSTPIKSPRSSGGGGKTAKLGNASVTMSGQSSAGAKIIILKDSQLEKSVPSDGQGRFEVKLSNLSAGSYVFSLYGEDREGYRSVISNHVVVLESESKIELRGILLPITKTASSVLTQKQFKGDMNKDGKVNLVDFSIMIYWFKRPFPPSTADLNSDGKIDIVDFSIMAFNWTG